MFADKAACLYFILFFFTGYLAGNELVFSLVRIVEMTASHTAWSGLPEILNDLKLLKQSNLSIIISGLSIHTSFSYF